MVLSKVSLSIFSMWGQLSTHPVFPIEIDIRQKADVALQALIGNPREIITLIP
jgi:hypothetical protein